MAPQEHKDEEEEEEEQDKDRILQNKEEEWREAGVLETESTQPSVSSDSSSWSCCLGFPWTVQSILAMEASERFAYYGFRAILVLYLHEALQYTEDEAVALYAYICALAYLTPVLGAVVSDLYWGKFRTICGFGISYSLGLLLVTNAAVWTDLTGKRTLSFVGLALTCLGTGGIKPCVSAFGADQLLVVGKKKEEEEEETRNHKTTTKQEEEESHKDQEWNKDQNDLLRSYFAFFYFSINAGAVFSFLVVPLIRAQGGFGPAFGVPTVMMVFAMLVFLSNASKYHVVPVGGNEESSSSVGTTLQLVALACGRRLYQQVAAWIPSACRCCVSPPPNREGTDGKGDDDDDDDDPLAQVRFSPSVSRSPRTLGTRHSSPLPSKGGGAPQRVAVDDSMVGGGLAPQRPARRYRAVAGGFVTATYGAMEEEDDDDDDDEMYRRHEHKRRGETSWTSRTSAARPVVAQEPTTTAAVAVGASPRAIFPLGASGNAIGRAGVITKESPAIRQALLRTLPTSVPPHGARLLPSCHPQKGRYTRHELEEASQVASVLPIMGMLPMFWLLFDQQGSVWTLQATRMNRHGLEPEQLGVTNPILTILLLPLFDKLLYPAVLKTWKTKQEEPEQDPTAPYSFHLARMSWGMIFAALAFVASALVDQAIVRGETAAAAAGSAASDPFLYQVSVFWQLPQFVLLSVAEILVSVTGLEFAYAASPPSTKAVVMSLFLLTVTVGDLAQGILYSSIFCHLPRSTTLYLCAALMMVNWAAFAAVVKWWRGGGGGGAGEEEGDNKAPADDDEENKANATIHASTPQPIQ